MDITNYEHWDLFRQTVNSDRLFSRIPALEKWAELRGQRIKFVSGLIATRANPLTRQREVLLVKGSSGGVPKPFWQFPGGHVQPGEDHIAALHRELHEELGVILPPVVYVRTYVPKPKDRNGTLLAIHAFQLPGDCDWDEAKENVILHDDVDQMVWTSDPLREENGQPRVLTEQVDFMLRYYLRFSGPANVNTCTDRLYRGEPDLSARVSKPRLAL